MSTTETDVAPPAAPRAGTATYLFVVVEGSRPLGHAARLRLDELTELAIGRGDRRAFDGGLALTIDDRRMSTQHARLVRAGTTWELIDAGSKNGCRVDGVELTRTTLRDGAWIALGQTLLRFRTGLLAAEPGWLDADGAAPVAGVISVVPAFAAQLATLAKLAPSRVSLLLTGATGTGKELVARAIHTASRRPGPFVAVNCAALPAALVESQLFGHRRGSFSGAIADHVGLVRAADTGTLLLDEVGDLPLAAQAALLRVLQEREVVPVGDTTAIPVDVRVIAATHRDLAALVDTGAFRADLYARLAGHHEALPPLAARREDTGTIIAAALRRHAAREVRIAIDAALQLATAPWPHNARELDKAIEAALALAGDAIGPEHLPAPPAGDPDDAALRAQLAALLVEHRGNVTRIAQAMGKARMQIQRWLKRFDLDPEAYR